MIITIWIIKTISIIIGFSSALVNDFLTLRFLKDFRIDAKENKILQSLAGISLISALVLSGTLLLSIFYEIDLVSQSVLLSSSIILGVVVLNEIIFRRIIVKKLAEYRIDSDFLNIGAIIFLRRLAINLNVVSIISWIYLLLIFQFSLTGINFITEIIIGDYVLICCIVLILINILHNFKSR